jgi:hypothetical protein
VVAGSEDLGILEVQEAAKVVSDSVDPSAKVIFGIMRDEKLKKGQVRIIVIATGFPDGEGESSQGGIERSLFAMPAPEQAETRGKIYNDVVAPRREEAQPAPAPEPAPEPEPREAPKPERRREEPVVTAQPKPREEAQVKTVTPPSMQNAASGDEDEAWGAIPNFLRRHKK